MKIKETLVLIALLTAFIILLVFGNQIFTGNVIKDINNGANYYLTIYAIVLSFIFSIIVYLIAKNKIKNSKMIANMRGNYERK